MLCNARDPWLGLLVLLLLVCGARVEAACEQLTGAAFCDNLPDVSPAFPLGWNITTLGGRSAAFACQLRIHQQELGLTDLQTAYVIATMRVASAGFNLARAEAGCENNRCRCPPECTPAATCQVRGQQPALREQGACLPAASKASEELRRLRGLLPPSKARSTARNAPSYGDDTPSRPHEPSSSAHPPTNPLPCTARDNPQACRDSLSACASCAPAERNCTCTPSGCPSRLAPWYSPYYGRGYTHMAWKDNYAAMAALFANCPLAEQPDILMTSHAVAVKVAVQFLINSGLQGKLPASIADPTDEQLVEARKIVNPSQVAGCSESGLPADCPVSDCASVADRERRRNCNVIAEVNKQARSYLALLRNPTSRVAHCGALRACTGAIHRLPRRAERCWALPATCLPHCDRPPASQRRPAGPARPRPAGNNVPAGGNPIMFMPLVRLSDYPNLRVTYAWIRSKDLDTRTTWLGSSVGWACGTGSRYLNYSGDGTGYGGQEWAVASVMDAYTDGMWSGGRANVIDLHAGWYSPSRGSGSFHLIVELLDANGAAHPIKAGTRVILPGSQSVCASTLVARVRLDLRECGNAPRSAYYSVSVSTSFGAAVAAAGAAPAATLAAGGAPAEAPALKPGWDDPPPKGMAASP